MQKSACRDHSGCGGGGDASQRASRRVCDVPTSVCLDLQLSTTGNRAGVRISSIIAIFHSARRQPYPCKLAIHQYIIHNESAATNLLYLRRLGSAVLDPVNE